MEISDIISSAEKYADMAREKGVRAIRLPVLNFSEWASLYGKPDGYAGNELYRKQQKRGFYYKFFLERNGIDVTMVTCKADMVRRWADENGHLLDRDSDIDHALAHYVNEAEASPSQCVHKRPLTAPLAGSGIELFASITLFGETQEEPEIISAVIHTRDGWVLESLEFPAAMYTMQEAFDLTMNLIDKHGVQNAFHDPKVRRPAFCPDCNELLVNVAGSKDYDQTKKKGNGRSRKKRS